MRLPWRKSETRRRMDAIERDLIVVQIAVADRLTPALRRLAVQLEVMLYRADGRWNRHQMIGDRERAG